MNDRLDQLDLLAQRAADDLGATTVADPHAGLARVYDVHTRRRGHSRLLVAAAVIGALSLGWLARGVAAHDETAPIGPLPPPPVHNVAQPGLCRLAGVACLGHRTYRFDLQRAVRWEVPAPFVPDFNQGPTTTLIEDYWNHQGNAAGVSVVEAVSPAGPDGSAARGFPAGATPRAFAEWLAARPFLATTTPVRTSIDGRPAWQVRARLAPDATAGRATCTTADPCHPVTRVSTGSITGIWGDMVADYTFVDLPGAGTSVVWSWSFGDDTAALDRNRLLVGGLSWPAH